MHTDVHELVADYFRGPLQQQSAYPYIEKAMESAIILVTGSYSFGMNNESSDLDIEFIVHDELYAHLVATSDGVQHLWVHDEAHRPLVDIKLRPLSWLQNRLSGYDPEVLWIYGQAVCIQDKDQLLPGLLEEAIAQFHSICPELLMKSYKDFRTGITISASRESLGEAIVKMRAIEAALVLPFLSQCKPYPYPKWKSTWLQRKHEQGNSIVALCEQWLAGQSVYQLLRDVINTVMIEAGHRDTIKHFWRKV